MEPLQQKVGAGFKIRGLSDLLALPGGGVYASADSMAGDQVGRFSSPSQAAIRHEQAARLRAALEAMDPLDREVLALRHFEELGNSEVAAVLGLTKTAASNRYIRALKRLKEILSALPGIDPRESAV